VSNYPIQLVDTKSESKANNDQLIQARFFKSVDTIARFTQNRTFKLTIVSASTIGRSNWYRKVRQMDILPTFSIPVPIPLPSMSLFKEATPLLTLLRITPFSEQR
jgi:hypothetical protein